MLTKQSIMRYRNVDNKANNQPRACVSGIILDITQNDKRIQDKSDDGRQTTHEFSIHLVFSYFFFLCVLSFMIIAIIICCYARATNVVVHLIPIALPFYHHHHKSNFSINPMKKNQKFSVPFIPFGRLIHRW